ncbi:apolipoprotein d [Holotrichia oblita]|uniref:Apolipoprotein d n=1 Tax=Holotrichia oblita TaxID=644536 RepID=A0ACB9SHF7_HOLOL|nr:apolipoprotein d [Holotrichia oblita]
MGVLRVLFLFLVIFIAYSSQHSYGLGECPEVTPMDNFKMRPMLGVWYVIKKTATTSTCVTYNFTAADEPNKYHLQQNSHLIIPGHFNYHYKGEITVPNLEMPAKMRVKFSLNLASASYIVIMTDYYNYAVIFTCQSIAIGNRKSISILSRRQTLDEPYLEEIQDKLRTFKFNPDTLSVISQENCDKPQVDPAAGNDTVSGNNSTGFVGKVENKLHNGLKYVVSEAKKIFKEPLMSLKILEKRTTNLL